MNLTLEIIRDELSHYPSQILKRNRLSTIKTQMKGIGLYKKGMTFSPHIGYVISAKNVNDKFVCPHNITLIVVGSADPTFFEKSNSDILILEGAIKREEFYEIFNEIADVFVKYQDIEQRLFNAISRNDSFETLISIGQELFNNPVLIFDKNYCLINETVYSFPGIEWSSDRWTGARMLPLDAINIIKTSPEYMHNENEDGTFFISKDYFYCNTLMSSATKNSLRIIVAIPETHTPLLPSQRTLIRYFANIVHMSFNKNYNHTGHPVHFEKFLKELLCNAQMEQAVIDRHLLSMNWKNTDTYICMTYQTNQWDKIGKMYYNICISLENQFPGSFAFYYDDNIIFLVNLTQINLNRTQVIYRLVSFLREGLFRVGISYDFFDFGTFPSYYQQTLGALEMGAKYAPHEWKYDFIDYVFYYFIHYGTSKIDGRHLCFPGLVRLYLYDAENHTDLLNTLRIYMQCERNVALTVKNLYIHRNTLYQRLKKIESIIDANLEEERVRTFILLSFLFVEDMGLQPIL